MSCPIFKVYSLYENGQDFLDIQYVFVCRKIYVFGGFKKPVCGYKPQVREAAKKLFFLVGWPLRGGGGKALVDGPLRPLKKNFFRGFP